MGICDDGANSHQAQRKQKDGTTQHLCHLPPGDAVPVQEWCKEALSAYTWQWAPNYSRFSPNDRPGTNLLFRHRQRRDLPMHRLLSDTMVQMDEYTECRRCCGCTRHTTAMVVG